MIEAEYFLDIPEHPGKVIGIPVDLSRRREQYLDARVLKNVPPIFQTLMAVGYYRAQHAEHSSIIGSDYV